MTKRTVQWVLLISLIFNLGFLGSLAYRMIAKSRRPYPGADPSKTRPPLVSMDLPDEKRNQLEPLRKAFFQEVTPYLQDMRREKKLLVDFLLKDPVDTLQIGRQVRIINGLQMKLDKIVVRQLIQEKSILSPEERDRFFIGMVKRMGGEHHSRRDSTQSRSKKP